VSAVLIALARGVLWGLCGLGVLLAPFGLPGTLVIFVAAAVYGWATATGELSIARVALLALLAAVAEGWEALAGYMGARRFGASRSGSLAAAVGGFIGAAAGTAVLPVAGTILGALLGAFLLAFIWETAIGGRGGRAATGAVLGRIAASFGKAGIAAGMGVLVFIWTRGFGGLASSGAG